MVDFSYHDSKLSDYGCIVASVNTPFQNSVQLGAGMVLDTIKNHSTHVNRLVDAKYDDVINATFDVCKNPWLYPTREQMAFTDGEISHFMRWLNQKKYYKFKPIYQDRKYSDLYFYGTFSSVTSIVIGGKVIGFTLTFISNSPFGYVDDKEFSISLQTSGEQFVFYDDSDEIGCLYPYFFQVECLAGGKLTISNDRDKRDTVIDNCTQNEVVTMDCGNKIIQTSRAHPTLFNDFNYNYPRIINNLENRCNRFTVSIPCNITIRYAPTRKAGILV